MSKTVDEILKQLGDDVKYVGMNFVDGYSITFDNGLKKHISNGDDLISCVNDLYDWYKDSNSPKGVAESLYNIIEEIEGKALEGKLLKMESDDNDVPCQSIDTTNYSKIFDEIIEIANNRKSLINVEDGKFQWIEFKEEAVKEEAVKEQPSELICEEVKEANVEKPKPQPKPQPKPKKEIVSTDNYPLYFSVTSMNYAQIFCYGYNDENERVYVKIDYTNPQDCEINVDIDVPTTLTENDITPIGKDEFIFNLEYAQNTLISVQQMPPIDPSQLYRVQ